MQPLRRIAIFFTEHDIELQAHWIFIKQNLFFDILSRGQYIKIDDRYLFLQIAKTKFGTPLKTDIKKYFLNKCQLNCSGISWLQVHQKYLEMQPIAIPNTALFFVKKSFLLK